MKQVSEKDITDFSSGKALPKTNIEPGIVVSVDSGVAVISAETAAMCASCSGRGGCGFNGNRHKRMVRAICEIPVKPGDVVHFVPGASPLLLASLMYLLPLVLFALGVVLFINIGIFNNNDINGTFGGLTGLSVSVVILYLVNKRFSKVIKARVISKCS